MKGNFDKQNDLILTNEYPNFHKDVAHYSARFTLCFASWFWAFWPSIPGEDERGSCLLLQSQYDTQKRRQNFKPQKTRIFSNISVINSHFAPDRWRWCWNGPGASLDKTYSVLNFRASLAVTATLCAALFMDCHSQAKRSTHNFNCWFYSVKEKEEGRGNRITTVQTHIKRSWYECQIKQTNSVALVRKRSIPTERPPPGGEVSANFLRIEGCHVVSATDPHGR